MGKLFRAIGEGRTMKHRWMLHFVLGVGVGLLIVPAGLAQRARGYTPQSSTRSGGLVGVRGFGAGAGRFGQFGPYVTRRGGFGGRRYSAFTGRTSFAPVASFRAVGAPGSTLIYNRRLGYYGTGLYGYPRSFLGGYPVYDYRAPGYGYYGTPLLGAGYLPGGIVASYPYLSGYRGSSNSVVVAPTYANTYNIYPSGNTNTDPPNGTPYSAPTVPLDQPGVRVIQLKGQTSNQATRPTPVVSISTPASTTAAPARVHVRVPTSAAQLYFNGVKTNQSGLYREFRTPQLPPRQGYQYKVKIVWLQEGKQREKEHVVRLQAGQEILVNLSDPRILQDQNTPKTPSADAVQVADRK